MRSIRIVLGLGNPGARYRRTRHNLGFRVVERLAAREGLRFREGPALRRRAWQTELERGGARIVLAKPRTYMNHSGRAGMALCREHRVSPEEMLVVYDDADLRFGEVRLRANGGSGGHNGVRSLIEVLGTREFPRVRLGVCGAGREERELADYVLDGFDDAEAPFVEALVDLGVAAVEETLTHGLETAMNRCNGHRVDGLPDGSSERNND